MKRLGKDNKKAVGETIRTQEVKKRIVVYCRCSTDDQATGNFTTLDVQSLHCRNMLDARGYELANFGINGVVGDDGYSGKDLNRPGIQSILKDIQKKKSFDGVIFLGLDRLSRNPRDIYSLIDLFNENDIALISVRESLDSSTALGRVIIGVLAILSAFERELTAERVRSSALARVKNGLRIGGRTPIGYKLIKDGEPLPNGRQPMKAVIDEPLAPHIRTIFEMAAANRSLTTIGQELLKRGIATKNGKIWRRQALSTIIKCSFYKGYLRYNGQQYKGKHDEMVSEKLWEKANTVLTARLPGHRPSKIVHGDAYLLSSLIICGECGSRMVNSHAVGRDKGQKFHYYECSRARQRLGCSFRRISAPALDEAIIQYFQRASQDQEVIVRAIGNAILEAQLKCEAIETNLNQLQKELNALRHNAEKLLQLAMDDAIPKGPTYKNKLADIEADIRKLEDKIQKLQTQKRIAQMDASSGEFLHSNIKLAIKCLDQAPHEAQKNLFQALIKNMVVYDDKIAINMCIEEHLSEILPKLIDPGAHKEKNPTPTIGQDEVLAPDAFVSTGRPIWGGSACCVRAEWHYNAVCLN